MASGVAKVILGWKSVGIRYRTLEKSLGFGELLLLSGRQSLLNENVNAGGGRFGNCPGLRLGLSKCRKGEQQKE